MTQLSLSLFSKSECLLGIMLDQGEHEIKKDTWVPFTRLRIGLVMCTIDIAWYKIK